MTDKGPLADLRVVEMGQLLAGPFCGQLLADFGAEVIKLEAPGVGDPMRQWGREKPHGKSLWWPVVARNKKSVTCNLRSVEGQELARTLITESDVVIENFRPGTLERWGLGFDALRDLHPGLIMARVTGYGQDGPYAPRAGFGSIGEAMGGIRYVTGDPDSTPSRAGISLGDSLAAVFATIGILIAVHHRENTGRGQLVDSAIYEAVLAMMESLLPEWSIGGYQRERTGSVLPNIAPSNVYPTKGGEMVLVAANQDSVFGRLATAMNRPELIEDPRYADHAARGVNMDALDDLIGAWTADHGTDEVLDILHVAGVPAGRIYTARDMFADPHFAARDAIVRLAHPDFGEFPMAGVFPKLGDTPGAVRRPGPELGEHNSEIYGGILGLSPPEQAGLAARGII
ncbi:CoA transferase [Gordonia sp. SID5947]|uniref:CaiB/BaiF CoA transferase family protein n=1 Tax=Gordonia sp. SID5947 TaxID=2690315 RepID=UPI0013687F57|nr:CoA transferase [Gordonia sp. SID5947]MYR05341.1 CoA transferase [Gordonia sp. SID5947]